MPEEIQNKIDLYRQGLSMVFSKAIADKSKIRYHESHNGQPGTFWVSRAFYSQGGEVVISPTGFKSFTMEEFDAETERLFKQAKDAELKMVGEK